MSVKYDKRADALYVRLSDKPVARTQESGDGRLVDYAPDGSVVGIELYAVSEGVDLTDLPEEQRVRRAVERLKIRVLA